MKKPEKADPKEELSFEYTVSSIRELVRGNYFFTITFDDVPFPFQIGNLDTTIPPQVKEVIKSVNKYLLALLALCDKIKLTS
jgi:hypothetical protein